MQSGENHLQETGSPSAAPLPTADHGVCVGCVNAGCPTGSMAERLPRSLSLRPAPEHRRTGVAALPASPASLRHAAPVRAGAVPAATGVPPAAGAVAATAPATAKRLQRCRASGAPAAASAATPDLFAAGAVRNSEPIAGRAAPPAPSAAAAAAAAKAAATTVAACARAVGAPANWPGGAGVAWVARIRRYCRPTARVAVPRAACFDDCVIQPSTCRHPEHGGANAGRGPVCYPVRACTVAAGPRNDVAASRYVQPASPTCASLRLRPDMHSYGRDAHAHAFSFDRLALRRKPVACHVHGVVNINEPACLPRRPRRV